MYYISKLASTKDCDELMDQLLESEAPTTETMNIKDVAVSATVVAASAPKKRERLVALAAGGQAKQYLGGAITADKVDDITDEEVAKLYARYEARLWAAMTKTLGTADLQLYPITAENQPKLVADLEEDPFVGHALSTATCELYHLYGMYLAPLTTVLTTAKHCQFRLTCPRTISEDIDDVRTRDSATRSQGCDSGEGDFTNSANTDICPDERPYEGRGRSEGSSYEKGQTGMATG